MTYYAGSFCPPTYGHAHILEKYLQNHASIVVVCSRNPNKDDNWFTPEQCKQMWEIYIREIILRKRAYISVHTYDEIKHWALIGPLTMIRGLRSEEELVNEVDVLKLNPLFDQFIYVRSDPEMKDISSTKARKLLASGGNLSGILHPKVEEMCKKFLKENNNGK